jgi:hypothetical protein
MYNQFPILCPPIQPLRTMILTNLILYIQTMSECFHVNLRFSGPVILNKISKYFTLLFAFLWLSPLWIRPGPLKNLNSLHPRMICTEFDWKWRAGFQEDFFKISEFFHSCNYLPLVNEYPLHLNKLESTPLKGDLCKVWLKLTQWFRRKSKQEHC